ncbi:transglutaminase-like domain-containing protein [Methylomonas koyamae]|uniref:transglutaminase-like domain-containing protein n=1 Tax=Methylomonas koyamae TaxID=702114 RepID=UPI000BC33CF6|nr:transglutaminase domain-containing protein [Methylomonas koyamae]ATG92569.1 hypothetical protein MKLM6_4411 [Methylomonas koyamae]
MNHRKRLLAAFAALVLSGAAWYGWQLVTAPQYDSSKTVSYSFVLRNASNRVLEHAEFRTYLPVRQTAAQACCERVEVSQPYTLESDDLGNQVLRFGFDRMPPYGVKLIRVTAQLRMNSQPNRFWRFLPDRYLQPEPLIESDHPAVQAAAANLLAGEPAQTLRGIYDWVVNNVRDIGYVRDERGALYALQQRQGDCTENAYLFTALARANSVPARAVAGYVLDDNGLLRAAAYHEWAEFDDGGIWRIADPQKRNYDSRYSSYVGMRLVDNRPDATFKFSRYQFNGEGLEVDME